VSSEPTPTSRRTPRWAWLLLIAVAVVCTLPRVRAIQRTAPYPLHEDESLIMRRAARILNTGDWNPHFFKYPSLPIYLTVGAFAVGSALEGAPASDGRPIGRMSCPYYEQPRIALAARYLFAGLSVLTMVLVGYAGYRALGEPALLVLAPAALALSSRYLMMSWSYLNVDLVGTFVCAAGVAFLFATRGRRDLLARAVVPGLIVGLATGSKYFLGLVGLPFALALLMDLRGRRRLAAGGLIVAFTLVGFLLSTPYSLLDSETFVRQVVFEIEHYQGGHRGAEGEPGLPQLAYYLGRTSKEYGLALCLVGLFGLVRAFRRDARSALLLCAFPLALLLFLSTQRVNFIRNALAIYALFPAFIAFGGLELARLLARGLRRAWPRGPLAGRGRAEAAGALAVLALLAPSPPWPRIAVEYGRGKDSRRLAAEWIEANVPGGTKLVVAEELQLDARPLEERYSVETGAFASIVRPGMLQAYRSRGERPVFVLPRFEPGSKWNRLHGRLEPIMARLTELRRFGNNGLPVDPRLVVHMGQPRLAILELPGG